MSNKESSRLTNIFPSKYSISSLVWIEFFVLEKSLLHIGLITRFYLNSIVYTCLQWCPNRGGGAGGPADRLTLFQPAGRQIMPPFYCWHPQSFSPSGIHWSTNHDSDILLSKVQKAHSPTFFHLNFLFLVLSEWSSPSSRKASCMSLISRWSSSSCCRWWIRPTSSRT